MKAMSKQQLADAAGVSVKVLMNWCRPYRKEFEAMGLKPKDSEFSYKLYLKFLCDRLGVGGAAYLGGDRLLA